MSKLVLEPTRADIALLKLSRCPPHARVREAWALPLLPGFLAEQGGGGEGVHGAGRGGAAGPRKAQCSSGKNIDLQVRPGLDPILLRPGCGLGKGARTQFPCVKKS